MAVSILDHEKERAETTAPASVPSFIVIGGGAVGARMARQLLRARAAGRLETEAIVVVDRDPSCAASSLGPPVRAVAADWGEWLAAHLGAWDPRAHLVPYHWAPHLLEEWLAGEALRAGGKAERGGPLAARGLPFERATAAGDRALSYASWPCPPMCIEPRLCPHTRGLRDWSLAADLARPAPRDAADESIVFRTVHLTYGVGTIPVREIRAARERVVDAARGGPGRTFVVATSSHCHALAATMKVTPVTV
jgi:hypothetical protein